MGCKTSKATEVVDMNSNSKHDVTPGTVENVVVKQEPIMEDKENILPGMITPEDTEVKAESPVIDSGRSSSSPNLSESQKEPLAYEVPNEETNQSLIKRHPPLRFRKLEENQVPISQEMINIKQAEAEKRRSAIMNERVKSARATSARSSRMRSSAKPNLQASGDSGIETHMEEIGADTEIIY